MDLRCVRDIFFFLSKYVLIKCFLIIFNINGYFTVSDSITLNDNLNRIFHYVIVDHFFVLTIRQSVPL